MTCARGLAVMAALMLSACAPHAPAPTAEQPRIVSLNPCADAILAQIAPENLLAVSHYSHDPRGTSMDLDLARQFRATGGTAEEIAALAPDLVVATAFLPPATEQALTRLGLRVVKTGSIGSVEDSFAQIRQLADLAGAAAAGEAMIARIRDALADAAPPRGAVPVEALVWEAGGLVPGDTTLISDLLSRTGFTNFSAARGLGQGSILPLEAAMANPPELILIAGSAQEPHNRMLHHPALAALAPDTTRATFPPRLTYCGGPTIPVAAARLAEIREGLAL